MPRKGHPGETAAPMSRSVRRQPKGTIVFYTERDIEIRIHGVQRTALNWSAAIEVERLVPKPLM